MPIKSVKMKISKNKKMRFFLMSQGSFNQKIRFLGQKMWPVGRARTDGHTDTRTHRVTTVGTLSGFQDFFLQPIIKDRPNCIVHDEKVYSTIHPSRECISPPHRGKTVSSSGCRCVDSWPQRPGGGVSLKPEAVLIDNWAEMLFDYNCFIISDHDKVLIFQIRP